MAGKTRRKKKVSQWLPLALWVGLALQLAVPPHLASAAPLADEEARRRMYDLIGDDRDMAAQALNRIFYARDERFIPVLVEMMRGNDIGLFRERDFTPYFAALRSLSAQSFGRRDWFGWVEWYGGTDLHPPPGFTGWKGHLLSAIDPGFAEFLRDGLPTRIRVEEIQWGGVRVDGIPALDNAAMVSAAEADYLEPGEAVFGLRINSDARAYPLRIMDWHEMANDVVGGVPVSLAYCTLCGAGVAFDGRASDGNTYTFGSSGFLFRSNKLMYDRQTRTLWNQLTGEPVLGPLAKTEGAPVLRTLPVVLTAWEAWRSQNPATKVLALETGFRRPYVPGAAYGDYFSSPDTMFPVWRRVELLPTKARVFALRIGGVPKAYPLELLVRKRVVNDTLAGEPVVLVAERGTVRVAGRSIRTGEVSYEAGGEVRAFQRGGSSFRSGAGPGAVLDESGRSWQVTEEALIGPGGEKKRRLGGHLAYWFGWYAFFPNTLVYGSPQFRPALPALGGERNPWWKNGKTRPPGRSPKARRNGANN